MRMLSEQKGNQPSLCNVLHFQACYFDICSLMAHRSINQTMPWHIDDVDKTCCWRESRRESEYESWTGGWKYIRFDSSGWHQERFPICVYFSIMLVKYFFFSFFCFYFHFLSSSLTYSFLYLYSVWCFLNTWPSGTCLGNLNSSTIHLHTTYRTLHNDQPPSASA